MKKVFSIISKKIAMLSPSYREEEEMKEKRKDIYMEIVEAEDRAATESEKIYPVDKDTTFDEYIEKAFEYRKKLQRKYVEEILDKYSITEDEELMLYQEALKEGWLMDQITYEGKDEE